MPLWAFAAATGLREVPEQGLPGPPRGPASPPPGLEQDKGWEQLTRGRRSCLLGPQEGDAAGTQGHQLLLQGFYKGIKFSDVLLVRSQLLR